LKSLFKVTDKIHERIIARMPFELTSDQNQVTSEIRADFSADGRMTRLLQGDVGTGKTVIAFYAMLAAVANGFQAAMMAPTEVLAQQHYNEFKKLLADSKVTVELLTGGMKRSERNLFLANLKDGETNIVIGTHALIENDVKFKKLGLVVVDEQHKFGVQQRFKLVNKARNPHLLVMTATPIPRTLALTLYGDLDISTLKVKPTGNVDITTRYISQDKLENLHAFMRTRIENNEKIIYVCPFVEEDSADFDNERKSVLNLTTKLKKIFHSYKIDSLFGRMENSEKEASLSNFRIGKTHILVTSTVMEVGIDISNATIIIIEDAHRFGLSQLHQLRGRVGRGGKESFCFLIADPKTEDSKQRLSILLKTNDGFEIAEEDLKIRGSGELYGLKQHGIPHFKFANPVDNFDLLVSAREDAINAYRNQELNLEELAEQIRLHFSNRFLITTTA
jgi:ATP-dependent DNA helicase RecG